MSALDALSVLRAPATIRRRSARVLEAAVRGELTHFAVALDRLDDVAALTAEVTRARYPQLDIPPHSRFAHFDAGGVPRVAALLAELAELDASERARALVDVVVVSVLLDAGAGDRWRYVEPETGIALGRSEGLAIASLAWVREGGLSQRGRAYEVDAAGLAAVSAEALARAFQVRDDNPLVGLEGRVHLLRALAGALVRRPDVFGPERRIGGLIDHFARIAPGGALPAEAILTTLLDSLSDIWPGRLAVDGVPLGDVWRHPAAGGSGATAGLVPFHKLSQWLAYSLLRPVAEAGLEARALDALTGLAEYRNGGLFIDGGVLVLRDPGATMREHAVDSELIVEWRALTVALLDLLAPKVAALLGKPLSLPAVLEGGSWAAGRKLAAELRPGGGPPLCIASDGTVF